MIFWGQRIFSRDLSGRGLHACLHAALVVRIVFSLSLGFFPLTEVNLTEGRDGLSITEHSWLFPPFVLDVKNIYPCMPQFVSVSRSNVANLSF